MFKEFVFHALSEKSRLDKWLVSLDVLRDVSRSKIQQMIKRGLILVNNKKVSVHNWLSEGDVIQVSTELQLSDLSEYHNNAEDLDKFESKIKDSIVFIDNDFIVLNKPVNIVVHPDNQRKLGSLIYYLMLLYPEIREIDNSDRPGIVHRLDKDVSGLLVVCRTKTMFEHLKIQFQNRLVVKEYLALVYGKMLDSDGTVDFPISRSVSEHGKMAAHPKNYSAKEAKTIWTVLEAYNHYTLLKIETKSGRTHQIRVHMNAIGHPIVGDKLYTNAKYKDRASEVGRIFLHASYLGFYDLDHKFREFRSEVKFDVQSLQAL